MLALFIIRGLPGTGKSTLARILAPDANFAADDFFYDADGVYNFDPSKLGEAHNQCARNVKNALLAGTSVAVANTFSRRWEYEPYINMAKKFGVRYYVIDLFDNDTPIDALFERNLHGVPRHVFKNMYDRWER